MWLSAIESEPQTANFWQYGVCFISESQEKALKVHFLFLNLIFMSSIAIAADPVDRTGKWDVNGPLGPNRDTLSFTAREGTWMNLDVHPDGTRIIFDLLGDLYVMKIAGGEAMRLTDGAAYDFQARFSPDGDQILFTSDRGGVFAVWIADFDGSELSEFRNINEGDARTWGGANWTPDGDWILARKRITDTSSIGISELWLLHKDGGSGIKIVAPKAEVNSFHASADGRYVYFGAAGPFSYSRSPHGKIWSVKRYDRVTGEERTVSQGNGSSASPVLSPDGTTIAFVRRIGTDSTLWLHNLADSSERQIWDGLDRDQIEAFGTHHIYPNYDWTPDGSSLIVWAGGKIVRVPTNGSQVSNIPFSANVSVTYHEPLRSKRDPAPDTLQAKLIRWPVLSPDGETMVFTALGHLYWMNLPDGTPERVTNMTALEYAPSFSPDGNSVLFTSWSDSDGGALHQVNWRRGRPGDVETLYSSGAQLVNPAFSADGKKILVVAGSGASLRGQDLGEEQRHDILLMSADGRSDASVIISAASRGTARRITRPTFSANGERIWYFDDEGGGGERGERKPAGTAVVSVKLDGTDKRIHMKFRYAQEAIVSPDESMVAFTEQHNAYVAVLPRAGAPVDFDPNTASVAFEQFSQDGGEWVTWSHDMQSLSWSFGNVVHRLPVDEISLTGKAEPRDAGDQGIQVLEVSIDANDQYSFAGSSGDLEALKPALQGAWSNANQVRMDVSAEQGASLKAWSDLEAWAAEAKAGIKLLKPETEEEDEEAETASGQQEFIVSLEVPRTKPAGSVALTGARIITMNGDEVIDNGTVVITENRIAAVGVTGQVEIPAGAKRMDVSGKTIMPGLIDVHAHMGYGVLDVNPQKEWQYYANLAYGVTTTHDPSASTQLVFSQAEMIEAGLMVGPRVFSTGFILYGAIIPDMAVINSYADALSHVRRLKSLGAFSVKSYMQPKREQRQWVIRAAAAEGMLVVPEGGGDFPANMGMLMDGHSGIEHALSVGQIYEDVIRMFSATRAGYTATLLVAYGGQEGENYFYQHDDVWKNEKLQSFFPPRQIDARSRRRMKSDEDDYNHMLVAEGLRKISDAGGLVNLGAHGQLQGLGAHWELWAISSGGMEPHDALRAATINGAEYLGMDEHLGTIETGKLADLIVLDRNPLENIRNSESINMTISNGVIYDSGSMDEIWPTPRERGKFHFQR
jgi:imidazolonepropionase-like amidohydrolase/Tol biopolymer transport system component